MPLYITQKTLPLVLSIHSGLKVEINMVLKVCYLVADLIVLSGLGEAVDTERVVNFFSLDTSDKLLEHLRKKRTLICMNNRYMPWERYRIFMNCVYIQASPLNSFKIKVLWIWFGNKKFNTKTIWKHRKGICDFVPLLCQVPQSFPLVIYIYLDVIVLWIFFYKCCRNSLIFLPVLNYWWNKRVSFLSHSF